MFRFLSWTILMETVFFPSPSLFPADGEETKTCPDKQFRSTLQDCSFRPTETGSKNLARKLFPVNGEEMKHCKIINVSGRRRGNETLQDKFFLSMERFNEIFKIFFTLFLLLYHKIVNVYLNVNVNKIIWYKLALLFILQFV